MRCRRRTRGGPSLAQLGQGQVSGELPATEPHWPALAVHVAGPGHRVAGHLARHALAEPFTDKEPGRLQPSEELLLAARACRRRVDRTPQHGAGGLLPAAPAGVLLLCPGRAAARRPLRQWATGCKMAFAMTISPSTSRI